MGVSDASLGRALLTATAGALAVLAAWINTYPFLDEESVIYSSIGDPQWLLLACAAGGACFIGGLMAFTLYHIYPHFLQCDVHSARNNHLMISKLLYYCFLQTNRAFAPRPWMRSSSLSRANSGSVLSKSGHSIKSMTNRSDWIIIGIAGVTCGGKTTLANRLKNALNPVYVFHQDKYFYPDSSARHVRARGLPHNNYDVLAALDMEALQRDVLATLAGDNRSHAHSQVQVQDEGFMIQGKRFLIVEGFTSLNYPPLMDLCDLRYYFVLEYGECALRRAHRLYDPPDIPGYFEACVWPEHLRYKEEILKDGRVRLVDGTDPDVFETVMADLAALKIPT